MGFCELGVMSYLRCEKWGLIVWALFIDCDLPIHGAMIWGLIGSGFDVMEDESM